MSNPLGRQSLRSSGMVASAPSVVEQAKLMDLAGSAWNAVKNGEIQTIVKLFPGPTSVYARGPMGENIFHIAMILNNPASRAIARYLVQVFGKHLVNCPIQARSYDSDSPGAYEGQTALHIAIVNKDLDFVKFLVQNGANVRSRAWGPFFKQGGNMYYGEYPLSFAACTGQKEVVSYLIRTGARVNTDKDIHGNTALHMCVYHQQKEMYDYLVEFCGAHEDVPNYQGLTTIVLAAYLGDVDMFQHIYGRRRRAFYTFGRFTSYSLALNEIDTVQDGAEYVPNAVETAIRKSHYALIQEPLVLTILNHKWETFARWQFIIHFVLYLIYVLSQTFLIWLISDKDHWDSSQRASQEYLGFVLSAIMLCIEIVDYSTFMNENYHRRLCVRLTPKYEPPLYEIPDNQPSDGKPKPNLLQRLSLKMGLDYRKMKETVEKETYSLGPDLGQPSSTGPLPTRAQTDLPFREDDYAGVELAQPSYRGPSFGFPRIWDEGQGQSTDRLLPQPLAESAKPEPSPSGTTGSIDATGRHGADPPLSSRLEPHPPVDVPFAPSRNSQLGVSTLSADNDEVDYVSVGVTGRASHEQDPISLNPGQPPMDRTESTQSRGLGALLDAEVTQSLGTLYLGQRPERIEVPEAGSPPRPGRETSTPESRPSASIEIAPSVATPSVIPNANEAALRRQRTGARSSGGDLPYMNVTLKRSRTEGGLQSMNSFKKTTDEVDIEAAAEEPPSKDPGGHVSRLRAFRQSAREGLTRIVDDPWLFIWHLHLVLTFIHFLTWVSTYHPHPGYSVLQFDDVVVSMMGMTGWLAVVYFFRGLRVTGRLAVTLERCMVAIAKWFCLYVLWNIGFTLGFYTLQKGATYVLDEDQKPDREDGPFKNIGFGMASLVMFTYGNATQEEFCNLGPNMTGAEVFCNIYFLLYVMSVYLLLSNLLLSLILAATRESRLISEMRWRHRWGIYVLKAERRLPNCLKRKFRLGRRSLGAPGAPVTYSHVFEVVEETKEEHQRHHEQELVDTLESLLENLKNKGRVLQRNLSGSSLTGS